MQSENHGPRGERRLAASSDLELTLGRQTGHDEQLLADRKVELGLHRPDCPIHWAPDDPTRQHALEDVQAETEPFGLKMWAAKAPCSLPFSDCWDSVL